MIWCCMKKIEVDGMTHNGPSGISHVTKGFRYMAYMLVVLSSSFFFVVLLLTVESSA